MIQAFGKNLLEPHRIAPDLPNDENTGADTIFDSEEQLDFNKKRWMNAAKSDGGRSDGPS